MTTAWSIIEGVFAGFGAFIVALFLFGARRTRRQRHNQLGE